MIAMIRASNVRLMSPRTRASNTRLMIAMIRASNVCLIAAMARANTSTFPYLAAFCLAFGEVISISDAAKTTTTTPNAATTTTYHPAAVSTTIVRRIVCAHWALLCTLLWRLGNRFGFM